MLWNETLCEDSYKSNTDLKELIQRHNLDLKPLERFGPTELEQRHKLLYDIISIIWA